MKELTIEEKAARYDEAIDIARKINSGEGVAAPSGWTTCEVIFPELKESEDERIRKELIKIVNDHYSLFKEIDREKTIAWLEKQGETFTKKDVDDAYLKGISDAKQELEKQSEQSTIDKVEPKFHEGDWVVNNEHPNCGNSLMRIVKVGLTDYLCLYYNGQTTYCREFIDKSYHLWTIQDAKNGDVLVCPKYAGDIIPNIFIFKNIERKDNDVFCHCSFLEKFRTEGYVANADPINTDFYPATKEQRDTLLKAMADAGYTFDFEKKELKKIIDENQIKKNLQDNSFRRMFEKKSDNKVEPKFDVGDEIKTTNEESLTITKIDEKGYWSEDLFICGFDDAAKWELVKQKPTELSVEDENYINDLIKYFSQNERLKNTKEDIVIWLKSLKSQKQWKPSEEQMKALDEAISLAKNCGEESSFDLWTLYEQLKAL